MREQDCGLVLVGGGGSNVGYGEGCLDEGVYYSDVVGP